MSSDQEHGSPAADDVEGPTDRARRKNEHPPLWKRPVGWFLGVVLVAVAGLVTDTFGSVLRSWLDPDEFADQLQTSADISVVDFQRGAMLGWTTAGLVPHNDTRDVPVDLPDDPLHADWLRRHDAYALMQEDVYLTLEGQRAQPVTITQLRPRLVACAPPVAGTVFYAPPEGENSVKQLNVNLDQRAPVFHEWDGLSPRSAPESYFGAHTISLAKGEQITISLLAFADKRSCKWHLDADMLVNGEKETLTLTEGTGPLAVSGGVQPSQYQSFYVLSYMLSEATNQPQNYTRVESFEGVCSDGQPPECLGRSWSVEDLAGYVE